MTQTRRNTHRLRNLIAIVSLIAGFVGASAWLINRPFVLKHVLSIVNIKSDWQIDIDRFALMPFEREINIDGISVRHQKLKKEFNVKRVSFEINPLGVLRGKLFIENLLVDGLNIKLPPREIPKEKILRKRLNLAKLILLRNVEIRDGRINQAAISFGKASELSLDEVRISIEPTFLGSTLLDVRTDGLSLKKSEKPLLSAGMLGLKTSTRLSLWSPDFPYINALKGKLKVRDITVHGMPVNELNATLSYSDEKINLSDLSIVVDERKLTGRFAANIADEEFDIEIDIVKPIKLPYIVKPIRVMDTAGALSGKVILKGKGLIPSKASGRGRIEIQHRFDASPQAPINLKSDVFVNNGVISLKGAQVSAGVHKLAADGTINTNTKRMKFSAQGKLFPIEYIFDKFTNKHLKKIFGPSDVTGTFEGWGRKFTAKFTGTTFDGGWKPITAKRIKTETTVTYNSLALTGTIISGIKKTGSANLLVKFGPKVDDAPRRKRFKLDAEIKDHPLETSLAQFGVKGTGNGSVHLEGPLTSFKGIAKVSMSDGSWHEIPLNNVSTTIDISKRKLVFADIKLLLPKQRVSTPGEIVATIGGGRTRFHGTPAPGLTIDATNTHANNRWQIKEISWIDPDSANRKLTLNGSIVSGGPMDLKVGGTIDLGLLRNYLSPVRSGSGPIDVDLKIRGTTKDPKAFGKITFNGNSFAVRGARLVLENLRGALKFNGSKIDFSDINANVDEGTLELAGWLDHRMLKPQAVDLTLQGDAIRYRTADRFFNIEFEGMMKLEGRFPSPMLKGNATVLDGRYTKDFTIIDVLAGGKKTEAPSVAKVSVEEFNPKLDLQVKNTGEFEIENNIGDIDLNINVHVKGTRKRPIVSGSIDTSGGEVNYLGVEFDVIKGFMEFREDYAEPYLEVHGEKEVSEYNVNLVLHGYIDNLSLDLSATSPSGPLEKRDVISLLLFGITEQERDLVARTTGRQLGTSLAAQSVSSIIERPVSRFTRMDIFRLEAADPGSQHVTRLFVGKEISDRLTLKFSTDLYTDDAVQTVIAEYQMTDVTLLKGLRSTDSRWEISGLLRFKMR